MPIYEFACQDCDENFEKLVRSSEAAQVNCPSCGSERTKKKVSAFAAKVQGGSFALNDASASSCSTGST